MEDLKRLLDPLLSMGKYEYPFRLGDYKVFFNLADVGSTSAALVSLPVKVEADVKAAKMAVALMSVNNYTFQGLEGEPLLEKYRFLCSLKEPVFDHFWDQFVAARNLQYKLFEEVHFKGKKSLPIQDSEQSGDSSSSPE